MRPIYVQCCIDPPDYASGPMPTFDVREVPSVVLEDLKGRIERELLERKRIRMIMKESV